MTVNEICTQAIRWSGARGHTETPSADETSTALGTLGAMLLALPILGQAHLTDVVIDDDYDAGENERIFNSTGADIPIVLPVTVTDSVTGVVRPPHNGAVVQIAGAGYTWLYVSYFGAWKPLHSLALIDEQPLGPQFDEALTAMLAVRLAGPSFKSQVQTAVVTLAQEGRRAIRQQFRQAVRVTTDPLLLNRFQRLGSNI